MPNDYDKPIILNPAGKHKYSIIWLHGLGADGNDFAGIVPMLRLDTTTIKFIFPHAKVQTVTINAGMAMRSWYDIISIASCADKNGVFESVSYVTSLIENEHQSQIPYNNIILAGFSQGGAIALHTGCNYQHKLGGIIALSTYVPLPDDIGNRNRQTPIFMAHGSHDPVVAFKFGQQSAELLKTQGFKVDFKQYPMPHSVCDEEIFDIAKFIRSSFSV